MMAMIFEIASEEAMSRTERLKETRTSFGQVRA